MTHEQKIDLIAKYQKISPLKWKESDSFSPDTNWNHLMPIIIEDDAN